MSLIQEIKTLQEISNDQSVTVAKVYFKDKDKVKQGENVIDLQTSKAVFSYEAEKDGYIQYLCKEGEDMPVGVVVARIYDDIQDIKPIEKATVPVSEGNASVQTAFSGGALKLIEKEGLDKALFSGKDFVTIEDVQAVLSGKGAATKPTLAAPVNSDDCTFQEISKAKKIEIASLSDVQSSGLGCTISIFVDTENIIRFAGQHMEVLKNSLLPFIIYETARLLVKYPEFNAYYADGRIGFWRAVNIGLAMDLDLGLKVIKFADMDKKDIKTIEQDILQGVDKYLDNKLVLNDITGITFTITDLSAQGISFFAPLINTKQSAILGISAIDAKHQRCVLSLTFDHRVTEGKKASEFLFELKERLESYQAPLEKSNAPLVQSCSKCMMGLDEINSHGGIGLFKILDCSGEEMYVCETCIAGW
jgi:pyruvate/2-oxoglutarate dehydrogenase complex dihydrolipoamide acyltransferase (E2) component